MKRRWQVFAAPADAEAELPIPPSFWHIERWARIPLDELGAGCRNLARNAIICGMDVVEHHALIELRLMGDNGIRPALSSL